MENGVNRKGFSLPPKGVFTDHRWILGGRVGKGWKRGESQRVQSHHEVWSELTIVVVLGGTQIQ